MYSVVLLAAVAMGGESADFGHRRGGCHGCYGGCYGGYGCSGYGGCYGGYGCSGYGYGCSGYGCSGYSVGYGGCSGYGCSGYGYGGCSGSYGCSGYGYGGCSGSYGCSGYGGCYGGYGVSYSGHGGHVQGTPMTTEGTAIVGIITTGTIQNAAAPQAAPATLVVKLPENAKLTVAGETTSSKATVRTFQTPDLTPGNVYAYTFKAEFKKGGKEVSVTKRVTVEAGKTLDIDLTQGTVAVASN